MTWLPLWMTVMSLCNETRNDYGRSLYEWEERVGQGQCGVFQTPRSLPLQLEIVHLTYNWRLVGD